MAATVSLHRPGWSNSNWNPHGLSFPIRFNSNDVATLDADVFDEWIGDDLARTMGMTVTRIVKAADVGDVPVEEGYCPTCGVTGDDPCRKPSGQTARRHRKRNR